MADTVSHGNHPLILTPNAIPQDCSTPKPKQYDTHVHTNDALLSRAALPINSSPAPNANSTSSIGEQKLSDIFPLRNEWDQLDISPQITASATEQDGELSAPDSIDQLYAKLDFQQATQSYLWALPLVSYTQWQEEIHRKLGAHSGDLMMLGYYEDKFDVNATSSTTAYILGFVDLNETGPLVIELPPGRTVGGIGDFWQRVIIDAGQASREKDKGSKYLVVPPGAEPPADTGKYHFAKLETTNVLVSFRVSDLVKGEALVKKLKIYPYAKRAQPGKNKLLFISNKVWAGAQPRGMAYWERLHQIIQKDPISESDRFDMAMLASLGIEKGKPFNPSDEQRKALEQGAQIGEMIAKRYLTIESSSKPLISATQANPIKRETTLKINDVENSNMSGR
ncbi:MULTISPECIES: DUF1254 domain-containing protein [Pseudomonas]|nr:DUF1254 domain-containing protein [Pseudomonas chlororaphis]TSD26691.1 DUF1254 domain-containing protein [Pseudomonas sp. ATCC 13985]AZD36961.1 hypothetical protein C4K22_4226 [Pseudomonas chlororaphis subsp. aurantiaca]AZD43300.1 hypothetical protein C4K21_4234 [Pseudomonas chlororaphis subsp. aurantiaca]AZD49543.1 hypothetical protein C4K20_4136 [Pseudomonas chlororaphis subsp. aurantiaca]AZD80666.1 hypothetical protein C4K15_4107 [Pseudomonas chlororaphis subsp. aurantiaca]